MLERSIWPGKYIPIIPVYGDELNINGKKILEGVIRHAKDPQRMYNYWASAETEAIALAPRAPFIGPKGSFDGFQNQWKSANQKNIPFLEYNPQNHAGQALPPPTRNAYEPPVAAITNARMQSNEDLKATTGIYDASLGARSNENSGIAIQRRNQQAQTNNFHFIDNLSRSLRHLGRILVDLIPHIYDTARTVRILGEDGQAKMVVINSVFEKDGEKKVIDLGHGKYDVTVSTGPSYATKRQEAADTILEFIRVYPNAAPIIGDLLAKNFDWPGADEIAERLKKSLPQEFQEQAEGQKIPPQIQAQLQQMTQMNEQLTQALNQAQDKLEKDTLKYQDSQRDRESKERIEQAKIEASLHKLLAEMDADDARFLLKEELAQINQNQKTAGAPFGAALADEIENPIGGVSPSTLMEV